MRLTLAAGTRLGPYEVQAALGAGGMGDVYRARDTRLGRDVAIKVLPGDMVHDPERVARFQREAQLLAALNHPHIAHLYGFEDADGASALVMELVEGETLADRIAKGPLPLDEALPIARQIADALESAHEQGIVHRDLKPANVKVRPDGTVKVLDFGLAKLTGPVDGTAGVSRPDATASPTITSPAMMTGVGMLLGTAAYMAPEQARGKPVDKRADIWAFGCVLYEMLTGRRAFLADEVSDTLAMVLMKDPDWRPLPVNTPAAIRTLVRRCLEKDRKRRLPDVGVARLEIDDAIESGGRGIPEALATGLTGTPSPPMYRFAWLIAAVAALIAIAIGAVHFTEPAPEPPSSVRLQMSPPPRTSFLPTTFNQALSPDGRYLAFNVAPMGRTQQRLALRAFDEEEARELSGTDGAAVTALFWSPDNKFIGFFADGKLKKVDIVGGPPQIICDLPQGPPAGGTWGPNGTILLGQNDGGLLRVASGGGTPVAVTTLDTEKNESSHAQPWFLPDGRHFLYRVSESAGPTAASSVYVGGLDDERRVAVGVSDTKAVFANGFLVFARDGVLMAQPFDAARLAVAGDPMVVAQNVGFNLLTGGGGFSVSTAGVLSYRPTSRGLIDSQLIWFDRNGKQQRAVGDAADHASVRLSPDGTRVATTVLDATRRGRDIWIHDLRRDVRSRFTFDPGDDWGPVWSPDGQRLVFSASRSGPLDLFAKNADGTGVEERLTQGRDNRYVTSVSADGKFALYHAGNASSSTGNDLWLLPLSGDRTPSMLLKAPFNQIDGEFSPDGRWIAYGSNESGRSEIYVMPFESPASKWQVSSGGGVQPRWRRDGKEIFFFSGDTLMAAAVDGAGATFQIDPVQRLFDVRRRIESYLALGSGIAYDVAADGQRFLINVVTNEPLVPPITVVTNWPATLR